jgi:hypothetical protein
MFLLATPGVLGRFAGCHAFAAGRKCHGREPRPEGLG